MAYTPTTSPGILKTLPAATPADDAKAPPQVVVITGKADPHAETRALLKEMLDKAPELIDQLTPEELEEQRQAVHYLMVGGGSARTLVGIAEIMSGGTALTQKEIDDGVVDPDADVSEDIPVTHGQMPQFADMLKRMMCRVADQQLTKETEADLATAAQTANSPEGAEAEKNVKENKDLRQRLDAACKAPAPVAP